MIGLSGGTGGELVYFELDNSGQLMDVHRKEVGAMGPAINPPMGRLDPDYEPPMYPLWSGGH